MPERLDFITVKLSTQEVTLGLETRRALLANLALGQQDVGRAIRRAFPDVDASRPVTLDLGQKTYLLEPLEQWSLDTVGGYDAMSAELFTLRNAVIDDLRDAEPPGGGHSFQADDGALTPVYSAPPVGVKGRTTCASRSAIVSAAPTGCTASWQTSSSTRSSNGRRISGPSRSEAREERGWCPSSWRRAETSGSARSSWNAPSDDADGFESVREAAYLRIGENPVHDPDWDVGVKDVLAMPYYTGARRRTRIRANPTSQVAMYYYRVPKGKVEVRRASAVISADGHSLGEVDGFVVDADEHITHVVLERGHFLGRKEVTIPIGAVARVESDAVHVTLSKDEVGALPTVRVGRHG